MRLRALPLNDLRRKPIRTAALTVIALVLSAAVFGGEILIKSLQKGLASLEERLGADIIVLPDGAENKVDLENILLQGTPGYFYMDKSVADEIAAIDISDLSALSCPMYISYQLKSLKNEAEIYFKRYLEKQYNRKLLDMGDDSLINQSLSISFFCDSLDAREIVESTLCSYFLNKGILLVPGFGNQRTIAESSLSYGLIGYDLYRNVDLEIAKNMIGGGNNESSKVEV